MRMINFFIYLAIYSGFIAGGGVLVTLGGRAAGRQGGRAAYNTYIMFQLLEQHADTIAQPPMSGVEVAVAAGLMPWLIIGGKLLIGIVLLFYGLRGLVRRLAQGLPPPQEAAETPEGRVGHALAYGAGAVAGGLLLVSSLINNADHLIPKLLGETTTAKVIRSSTTQTRTGFHGNFAFQFRLADGTILQYEKKVPVSFVRANEQGAEIEIRYMPDNPAQHMFPGENFYTEFIVRLEICLLLVFAGIAGVQRNLNYV